MPSGVTADSNGKYTMYYNASSGKLVKDAGDADAIDKGTTADGGCKNYNSGSYTYTSATVAKGLKIQVVITKDGEITCSFA